MLLFVVAMMTHFKDDGAFRYAMLIIYYLREGMASVRL